MIELQGLVAHQDGVEHDEPTLVGGVGSSIEEKGDVGSLTKHQKMVSDQMID